MKDPRFQVRPATEYDREVVAQSFRGGPYQSAVPHPEIYTVAVVVREWTDHYGPHTGEAYILCGSLYPYCWDSTRFVKV